MRAPFREDFPAELTMQNPPITITEQALAGLCNGDANAVRFCAAFHEFCHALDDVLDRDNPGATRETFIKAVLGGVIEFSSNPFFQAYRAGLLALITQAFISWADSMDWQESGDPVKEHDADVIKGLYHEVFFHVAFLCGGYDHARKVTAHFREYDHEPKTETNKED